MSPERVHLAVVRGQTTPIATFRYVHSLKLSEDIPAGTTTTPITQIITSSIPVAIPSGTSLRFKKDQAKCQYIQFTTNGVTPANTSAIAIQPYIGNKISCDYTCITGIPVDLTGRTYRAYVRRQYEDTTPLIQLRLSVSPLLGTITVACPTTTAEPSTEFHEIPEKIGELQSYINNAVQEKLETGKISNSHTAKILKKADKWDLEYDFGIGNPTTVEKNGYFFLIKEATR
jgi:hypothetical protein